MKIVSKLGWVSILAVVVINLGACNQNQNNNSVEENNKPKVVSTSTIIADLTTQIGGDEIEHTGILKPGTDPHVYEPVPQDSIALENADLIIYNGYNLEPGIIKLIEAAGIKAKKFAVAEEVKPLDFEYQGQIEPDPHVWGDAENGIIMVKGIRDQLIAISPEDEQEFKENAEQLIDKLTKTDEWITQQVNSLPPQQRKLITTHDAFQYYANAYGFEIPGTLIGISTEEQPSAQTLKELVEKIKSTGVKAIFAETTINPTLINTVAEEAGVKLPDQKLYSDSIGAPGSDGDSYIKMLEANTKIIVEALGE